MLKAMPATTDLFLMNLKEVHAMLSCLREVCTVLLQKHKSFPAEKKAAKQIFKNLLLKCYSDKTNHLKLDCSLQI